MPPQTTVFTAEPVPEAYLLSPPDVGQCFWISEERENEQSPGKRCNYTVDKSLTVTGTFVSGSLWSRSRFR